MKVHSPNEQFRKLLEELSSKPFKDMSSEKFKEFVILFWHSKKDFSQDLKLEVDTKLKSKEQKVRALYLLDTLRRNWLISDEQDKNIKEVLASYKELRPAKKSESAELKVKNYRLSTIAFEWGLEEDACDQMQNVIQYQTRHYADTGIANKYGEPSP